MKSAVRTLAAAVLLLFVAVALNSGPAGSPDDPATPAILQESRAGVVPQSAKEFTLNEEDPWVLSTLRSMTLEEKVAQMVAPRAFGYFTNEESDGYRRLVHLVKERKVGGIVFSLGDVFETAALANKLQRLAAVPLLVSSDFEWGPAMRIKRSTVFPPAMAIGATGNPDFAYKVGEAIAKEGRAMGIHQNFSPVVDINNNPDNPVINIRSFGETKEIVSRFAIPFIEGTQESGMIATAKHFPGHGATDVDSHNDLPVIRFDRKRLEDVEFAPFRDAVREGVLSMMIGHLSIPAVDDTVGLPSTLSKKIITGVLRDEMGFKGLVVTDAMEMSGVSKEFSPAEAAVMTVRAGTDMVLLPPDEDGAIDALVTAVRQGLILESRIDASVRKILAAKKWIGLDMQREVSLENLFRDVAPLRHTLLSEEIARNAVTLVKNENSVLPLSPYSQQRVALISVLDNGEEVGAGGAGGFMSEVRSRCPNLSRGFISPRSFSGEAERLLESAKEADVILLAVYNRVRSGHGTIALPQVEADFINEVLDMGKPVALVSFGNPYLLKDFKKVNAYIAAYSESNVMVRAAAEAVFGEAASSGTLPITIPDAAARGDGLKLPQVNLRFDAPEVAGFDPDKLGRIDAIINAGIRDSAYPAAEAVVVKDGIIALDKAYGRYDYSFASREIDESTMFDLASCSKVISTTTAVMKLYEEKKIDLDAPVASYIPEFGQNGKEHVTIRNLLLHNSGLPGWKQFYLTCTNPEQVLDSLYATRLIYKTGDSTVYSDLGFITLGRVVAKVTGMTLDKFMAGEFFGPLSMTHTMYNPSASLLNHIAPTEYDSVLRRTLVRGVVHDENAYVLGGVSGHAGLFSTALDLARIMQLLVNGGTYGGTRYLQESTVKLFTTRQSSASTRALGWDTKSPGRSLAGTLFPPNSFGHTGFTGTMVWADPARKLFGILLTNRVYPTRENLKISSVRPKFYDAIIEALVEGRR